MSEYIIHDSKKNRYYMEDGIYTSNPEEAFKFILESQAFSTALKNDLKSLEFEVIPVKERGKTTVAVTKNKAMFDFEYLEGKIEHYLINKDVLVNDIVPKIRKDKMSNKEFIIWSIQDLFEFVFSENGLAIDKKFLKEDYRALRIKERYSIK